jgi:integration host factor subunit beta
MTRSELISQISSKRQDLTAIQVEDIVCRIFDTINKNLSQGGRVELRGFGTFTVRKRAPRQARNPRTGESVMVEAKSVPFFKTGKDLREQVNSKQ